MDAVSVELPLLVQHLRNPPVFVLNGLNSHLSVKRWQQEISKLVTRSVPKIVGLEYANVTVHVGVDSC